MSILTNYNCHYCNRKYKLKENYDKHAVACEFLHKMKMKSHDDIVESMEPIPNHRELFKMVQMVMLKNKALENEIKQLRNIVNIRHKREVIEWLNQNKNNNMRTFIEWYKSIEINEEDLQMALNNDLTRAMEHILKKITGTDDKPPICRFKEKPNQLFIFDYENKEETNKKSWRLASHIDIEKMVIFICHALLKKFVIWQNDNRAFFVENDKNKDLEILYMSRITGIKNPLEKRTADIKKWLYGLSVICYDSQE